jgi:hypothetical protein
MTSSCRTNLPSGCDPFCARFYKTSSERSECLPPFFAQICEVCYLCFWIARIGSLNRQGRTIHARKSPLCCLVAFVPPDTVYVSDCTHENVMLEPSNNMDLNSFHAVCTQKNSSKGERLLTNLVSDKIHTQLSLSLRLTSCVGIYGCDTSPAHVILLASERLFLQPLR